MYSHMHPLHRSTFQNSSVLIGNNSANTLYFGGATKCLFACVRNSHHYSQKSNFGNCHGLFESIGRSNNLCKEIGRRRNCTKHIYPLSRFYARAEFQRNI